MLISPSVEGIIVDALLYAASTLALTYSDIPWVTKPDPAATAKAMTFEVPRAFRTVHPLGWTIWKGEVFAPSKEELLTGIQG
jgi:hypothetical protein